MDDFLTVFNASQVANMRQVLAALLLSFVLCSVYATVYRWTFKGFSYSRTFVQTMILAGMITAMLIMAIGNNLARGLGILGTLAVVRFRTPVRDPRDMTFLFACIATGISCGAHIFGVAIVGTLVINAAALYLHWSPFASRRAYEGLLRFSVKADSPAEEKALEIMKHCCTSFALIGMREAAQGELMEYSYQVRLVDPSYQSDLLSGIDRIDGIQESALLMHRITVEL